MLTTIFSRDMVVKMSTGEKSQKDYFCINQTAKARVTIPPTIVERGNSGSYHSTVLVTPLGAHNTLASVLSSSAARHGLTNRPSVESRPQIIEKVILKATVKEGKEFKLFVLRNIEYEKITCRGDLKNVITTQLPSDIVSHDFDIGIENGGGVISLRTQADLSELWSDIIQGKVRQIWCDGLKVAVSEPSASKQLAGIKRKITKSGESSKKSESKKVTPSKEEREEKVTKCMASLREKHADKYTPMQYRIWSELIVNEAHESLDEPPTCSMFKRACRNDNNRQREKTLSMSEAITHAAQAFSSAFSPPPVSHSKGPTNMIDSRSKCYTQLSELNNLRSAGVITEDEYLNEKSAIMEVLKQLK